MDEEQLNKVRDEILTIVYDLNLNAEQKWEKIQAISAEAREQIKIAGKPIDKSLLDKFDTIFEFMRSEVLSKAAPKVREIFEKVIVAEKMSKPSLMKGLTKEDRDKLIGELIEKNVGAFEKEDLQSVQLIEAKFLMKLKKEVMDSASG